MEEEGAEDYPFYIMPLILLFMNLTSLRGRRVDDPFVSGRADFVTINMLDRVTDCIIVDFILLRPLIAY